jgi:hypothetical protein
MENLSPRVKRAIVLNSSIRALIVIVFIALSNGLVLPLRHLIAYFWLLPIEFVVMFLVFCGMNIHLLRKASKH